MRSLLLVARLVAPLAVLLAAPEAGAIPAYARTYGTACGTCHTVYPKLNAFGEAFRRRGFRFPGVDSDAVKQEAIPLGQEAYRELFPFAIWPGLLPAVAPLAVGVEGRAVATPFAASSAARARGGAAFSLQDLVAEVHLWAGGSLDDAITYFVEVTATTRGQLEVENAALAWSDLAGPPGVLNLVVGQASPGLTSFGPHGSYLVQTTLPQVPVAALLGATTDGFRLGAPAPGLELNGVAFEHLTYALGAAAGATVDGLPTLQAWARVGALFAGAEAGFWHDAALGADLFGAQATSRLALPPVSGVTEDSALVLGGAVHLQVQAWELDTGFYAQRHVSTGSRSALALVHYDELSFMAFPWLVAAVRVDAAHLAATGLAPAWSLRVTPGVAVLFRQNLKATLTAQFEAASGVLPGGWGPAGGLASPSPDRRVIALETETVMLNLAAAF